MYLVEAWSALRVSHRREPRHRAWLAVGPTIIALGVTSLFTDISSEMVTTVLPVYLVLHVGLTPLQFGFLDGLSQGLTAVFRIVSGLAADRWRRHKEVAAGGYGLSALCKLGLLGAGGSWALLTSVIAADRFGKGIRTAPRDALISLSVSPANTAAAFGVHRTFDGAGAMLGPVVALLLMWRAPGRFDVVFVCSFAVALIGLAALLLFVDNVPESGTARPQVRSSARAFPSRLDARRLMPLVIAASLLGAATIGDAFLYLLVQRQAAFNAAWFPLLYVGTACCYLLLAVPIGRFADLAGRRVTLLGGHLLLVLAYLVPMLALGSVVRALACVGLLGAYYAATDGVLMALTSDLCEPEQRAGGMSLVGTVTSGGRFLGALGFGALWTAYGATAGAFVFAGLLAAAIVASGFVLAAGARREEPLGRPS